MNPILVIHPRALRVATPLSLLIAALGPLSPKASAQLCPQNGCVNELRIVDSRWDGHVVSLGVNMAIGGLTGGIGNSARGKSFWRGFALGAGGGAVVYGGKRISGGGFSYAGLVGRQTSALGTSIVANAAASRGAFQLLVVPIGPTRLYLNRAPGESSRFKIDLPATIAALYLGFREGAELDLNRSASAGALVFVQESGELSAGTEFVGVIRLREGYPDLMNRAQAHEQVHVSQTDFSFLAWSEPLERLLLSQSRGTRWIQRYFDFRLDGVMLAGLNAAIPHSNRPWEHEATFLSRTDRRDETGGLNFQY